jgi:cyclophilin family peptidyl-prolyl cis-trans isomerase
VKREIEGSPREMSMYDQEPTIGSITFGLYGNKMPRTSLNWEKLALGRAGISPFTRSPMAYFGSAFEKTVKDLFI